MSGSYGRYTFINTLRTHYCRFILTDLGFKSLICNLVPSTVNSIFTKIIDLRRLLVKTPRLVRHWVWTRSILASSSVRRGNMHR